MGELFHKPIYLDDWERLGPILPAAPAKSTPYHKHNEFVCNHQIALLAPSQEELDDSILSEWI